MCKWKKMNQESRAHVHKESPNMQKVIEEMQNNPAVVKFIEWTTEQPYPIFSKRAEVGNEVEEYRNENNWNNIPWHIIDEILSNLQMTWFLPGVKKVVSQDTIDYYTKKNMSDVFSSTNIEQEIVQKVSQLQSKNRYQQEDVLKLHTFFDALNNMECMKYLHNTKTADMPWGLLRSTSLYDIDYTKFASMSEYLEFLYINIEFQQKVFWPEIYAKLVQENAWLFNKDQKWQDSFFLSNILWVADLHKIMYKWREYETNIRVTPWHNPLWLTFYIGINVPEKDWNIRKDNFFLVISVFLEKKGNEVVPVIHTIQATEPYGIGMNDANEIISIEEGNLANGEYHIKGKDRAELVDSFAETFVNSKAMKEKIQQKIVQDWYTPELLKSINTLETVRSFFIDKNAIKCSEECKKDLLKLLEEAPITTTSNIKMEEIFDILKEKKIDVKDVLQVLQKYINKEFQTQKHSDLLIYNAIHAVKSPNTILSSIIAIYLLTNNLQNFENVEIISGNENLWLMMHGGDRSYDELSKSAQNNYAKAWELMHGTLLPNWRYSININNIIEGCANDDLGLKAISIDVLLKALYATLPSNTSKNLELDPADANDEKIIQRFIELYNKPNGEIIHWNDLLLQIQKNIMLAKNKNLVINP